MQVAPSIPFDILLKLNSNVYPPTEGFLILQ